MSNITEWIKYELYPTLFESIDKALPEHDFRAYSGGWRSKTYLDSSPHSSRVDKTVVTKKAPAYILEQGGEVKSLVDYVMDRDNSTFIEAVKTLSNSVGLTPPENPEFNPEAYKSYKETANILEEANQYFIYCLENSKNAEVIIDYLVNRGYSKEDIKAMELGFIPSQDSVFKYLAKRGFKQAQIKEALNISNDTRVGTTHSLTIPYRSGGNIKGFKFRTIGADSPKYLNSKGLDRNGGFFNLSGIKGDKDVVIVEGELDSLSASLKGVENVVATGGSSISSEQIQDAIRRGAKSFTICLDNEEGKEEQTIKTIERAVDVITAEGVSRVYIAELPNLGGKTDPDRLIKERGVEELLETIREATPFYEYRLQNILEKYGKIEEDKGNLTERDKDNLLDEVVETATRLEPLQRDQFNAKFTSLEPIRNLGITEESLSITADRLKTTKDKETQRREFNSLMAKAKILQDKGETDKALELISNRVKEVKLRDKATAFSELLKPIEEDKIKERLRDKPNSLSSGYTIGGEELLLPSGAISIFTAPTSHGKTTFLINLALNVSNKYPDKEAYLFSYEEDSDSILINSLNTYLDADISGNNRRTLNSYFTTGSTEYVKGDHRDYFKNKKDEFFRELIDSNRLRINYTDYNSETLIEAIRYLSNNTNIGAVFIDYIQLMNLPKGKHKTYSRQEEIKQICIALKDVAVETGLPIILGAQFNRTVTNQLHLHPTKIGEAGDIERIANLIVGFWNNNFKATGTEGELSEIVKKNIDIEGNLYTEVLKNRGGRVGLNELLSFNGNTGKISNGKTQGVNIDPFK